MADAARQWDEPDNTPGNLESKPPGRPELEALEGGGETSAPTGNLQAVPDSSADLQAAEEEPEAEQVPEEPSVAEQDPAGHVYKPSQTGGLGRFWLFRTRRRIALASAASVTALTIVLLLIFFSLLPFKILHIVNNLQGRFFATSQAAADREVNALFSDYLKRYVLPGLLTCPRGSTIDKRCTPRKIQGNSLVSRLYFGWRRGNLEYNMAQNYGLEFQRQKNTFFMKVAGTTGDGIELDKQFRDPNSGESLNDYFKRSDSKQFQKVSRAQIRTAINDSLDKETFYRKTWYRFKIGRLMEKKYGVRRCIVFCTPRDNFDDWKGRKKDAATAYIINRLITPRSESLSLVLKCVIAGAGGQNVDASSSACPNVTSVDEPNTSCDTSTCAPGGAPEDGWQRNLRGQLEAYRALEGNEAVDKLLKEVDLVRKYGYWAYVYNKALQPDFNSKAKSEQDGKINPKDLPSDPAAREAALKAFQEKLATVTLGGNIIGALNTTANIMGNLGSLDKQLHKMTYITNAATMVAAFSMYRTYADEIKTGNVDQSIVGSFTKTLSGGVQDQADQGHQVGGKAGAEQTPLYQTLVDRQPAKVATAASKSDYHCGVPGGEGHTDKPIPAGQLMCPETNLANNPTANEIAAFTHSQPLASLIAVSQKWKDLKNGLLLGGFLKPVYWTINQLTSFITEWGTKFIGSIPGASSAGRFVEKFFENLMRWLTMNMVPSPIAGSTSGGRMFDVMAGGADVAGNDYAHYGLGGQALSPKEVKTVLDDQQQLELARYHSESFFARMFDASNPNSATAKVALAMPSSASDASHQFLSFLTNNPFAKITHAFASLIHLPKAAAATPYVDACLAAPSASGDCFAVTNYGYRDNDPVFSANPEAYWTGRCVMPGHEADADVSYDQSKDTYKWNKQARLNGATFMPENDNTNGCLLIQAMVGSAGAKYDPSLLTNDDQSD